MYNMYLPMSRLFGRVGNLQVDTHGPPTSPPPSTVVEDVQMDVSPSRRTLHICAP